MAQETLKPKTFYLNEQHELTPKEKIGGGGTQKLAPIDWASKGQTIKHSLGKAKELISKSQDPLKDSRFFLLAKPVSNVIKESKNKKKAPEGTYSETPNYASGEHSRIFHRLGLDLLQVNEDGTATVHSTPEGINKLMLTSESLQDTGIREKSRWVTIDTFSVIPPALRIDNSWLETLQVQKTADAIIELQPLLNRVEIDEVVRAIGGFLKKELGEILTGTGTDFSGRQWFRGTIAKNSLRAIAKHFFSVQSLHPPLFSIAAARSSRKDSQVSGSFQVGTGMPRLPDDLPTVAVLDTGVPDNHRILSSYCRGRYVHPLSAGSSMGSHGSLVASRVVFGDHDYPTLGIQAPVGACRFYDVLVSIDDKNIEEKSVMPSMEAVVGTAPDVRVFNLSFDTKLPLDALDQIDRRERLLLLQDLDNFIFAKDVIVVVSAGNTRDGVIPSTPYPHHYDDKQWQLGSWARSFNSLTCGSTVERLAANGLAQTIGWPSPFARIGPGICESPKPDFCAHGGNCTDTYQYASGLGVYGCSASGFWEDHSGTSYAAPLLSREAAFALHNLQSVCERGAKPFGTTVKAFLALTAKRPNLASIVGPLAKRALGMGKASVERLHSPLAESAVLIWQGIIDSSSDIARVHIPIPKNWLKNAAKSKLRLVVAWDSPVNQAAHDVWACRKVVAHLRPFSQSKVAALRSIQTSHHSYPLLDRTYDLSKAIKDIQIEGDFWLLELAYEQTAEYSPGIAFSPQQRVSFAAELFDESEFPVSPQAVLQSLPIAHTLQRLSIPATTIQSPIILKTRV